LFLYEYFITSNKKLPARYQRISFWMIRFALALVAGALAIAYEVETRLLAIHIGASAPAILRIIGEGIREAQKP
jgi:hypothetical protein